MEIKDYIKIIDNTLRPETLEVIKKWIKHIKYEEAEIVTQQQEKGFVDNIIPRYKLKETLDALLSFFSVEVTDDI